MMSKSVAIFRVLGCVCAGSLSSDKYRFSSRQSALQQVFLAECGMDKQGRGRKIGSDCVRGRVSLIYSFNEWELQHATF